MLQGPAPTIEHARELRSSMSLPEVLLWRALRQRPGGHKFRRQHPSGPYVADFYCHDARLVIEIDGKAHDFGDRPQRDEKRDRWFVDRQFTVLRIPAQELLSDVDSVLRFILAAIPPREDQE